MPIAVGILGGAALALVQYAITRAFIARSLNSARGGAKLYIALKLPLSIAALALISALAFAAGGYTLVSAIVAIYQYKRRGE